MQSVIRYTASTLVLLALSAAARAETTDCTEVVPPYTITAPGIYCLKRSFFNSSGVSIQSDDVVFDLNGHVLALTNSPFPATGVTSSGRSNVTVRNGTIRGGRDGVVLDGDGTSGNVVEQMRVEGSMGHYGINVSGRGHVVRNNVLIGLGALPHSSPLWGINATGTGIRISGNHLVDIGLAVLGEVAAIRAIDAPGALIEHNVIVSSTPTAPVQFARGIIVFVTAGSAGMSMKTTVVGNRIVGLRDGILNGTSSGSVSLFLDNTVGGAVTPFSGGIMPANSNFSF